MSVNSRGKALVMIACVAGHQHVPSTLSELIYRSRRTSPSLIVHPGLYPGELTEPRSPTISPYPPRRFLINIGWRKRPLRQAPIRHQGRSSSATIRRSDGCRPRAVWSPAMITGYLRAGQHVQPPRTWHRFAPAAAPSQPGITAVHVPDNDQARRARRRRPRRDRRARKRCIND